MKRKKLTRAEGMELLRLVVNQSAGLSGSGMEQTLKTYRALRRELERCRPPPKGSGSY